MSFAILTAVTIIGLGAWLWGPDTRDGRDWARRGTGTGSGLGFGPGSRYVGRDEFGLPGDFDGRGGDGRDGGPGTGGTPGPRGGPAAASRGEHRPEPAGLDAFRPSATVAASHRPARRERRPVG